MRINTTVRPYRNGARTLLSRLEVIIDRGNAQCSARCPAHDDKSLSLSVRQTDDGKVLIHCFAGCTAEDVLTAVGLTFRDLYPDRWMAAYRAGTANKGSKFTAMLARNLDPLDVEPWVLRIAASDLRAGKALSAEDRARVEVARLRLEAAEGREAA